MFPRLSEASWNDGAQGRSGAHSKRARTGQRLGSGMSSGCAVPAARRVSFEDASDLVAHPPEDREFLLVGAGGVGGIVKAPVIAVHLPGKHRARLVGIAAD